MDFDNYQTATETTAVYPGKGSLIGLLYCALGLGEAGEFQGKVKKVLRDDDGIVTDEKREAMESELGDVMWYVSQVASELGLRLSDVAQHNLDKLADRKERGVLKGSGDNR